MVNSSGNGFVVTVEGAISVEDYLSECVPGFTSVKIPRQSGWKAIKVTQILPL